MDISNMIDLGREYDNTPCSPCSHDSSDKKGEKRVSYPELYISGTEEMPDMPKGDFYILAKVCVSRLSIDAKNEENSSVSLEVKAMKVMGEAPSEEDEDEYAEMEILLEEGSAGKLAKQMESYDEGED